MHVAIAGMLIAVIGLSPVAPPVAAAEAACSAPRWVGAWSTSMGYLNDVGYAGQTLRMIVSPHLGGSTARVRLTNPLADNDVTVSAVHVGRSKPGGAALVAGSNVPVTFGGRAAVTIPGGGQVASDPVPLRFRAFQPLAVSMFVAAPTGPVSEHFDGHQLSWIAPGPMAADETGLPFVLPTFKWTLLGGVEVYGARGGRAVVTLGDSITDGFPGTAVSGAQRGHQRQPGHP